MTKTSTARTEVSFLLQQVKRKRIAATSGIPNDTDSLQRYHAATRWCDMVFSNNVFGTFGFAEVGRWGGSY